MNLADWLKKSHSFPEQLDVMEALCAAVSAARQKGVVHRALAPAQIEVASDTVRINSGPARPGEETYLAPEVREGGEATAKADIFSTGVILYEILAGRHPFLGQSGRESSETPPPLRDVRPEVSRDLADAITACLERDPEWRPSDLSYLTQVLSGLRGTSSKSSPKGGSGKTNPPKSAAKKAAPAPAPEISRPILSAARATPKANRLPVLALLIVLLGGASAWMYLKSLPPQPAQPPPTRPPMTPPPALPSSPVEVASPSPEAPRPSPKAGVKESPRAEVSSSPAASPSPSPKPTPEPPKATPEPVRATPTPPPVTLPPPTAPPAQATPAPIPSAAPAVPLGPASLTAVSPRILRKSQTVLLDIHGNGLRADHQARILRTKGGDADGISVTRQRYVNSTLFQVLVQTTDQAAAGAYSLLLVDGTGIATNALAVEIAK